MPGLTGASIIFDRVIRKRIDCWASEISRPGSWIKRDKAGHRANAEQLLQWCAQGKLSSHVHAVYPLREAPDAVNAIAARQVMGKVILRP